MTTNATEYSYSTYRVSAKRGKRPEMVVDVVAISAESAQADFEQAYSLTPYRVERVSER